MDNNITESTHSNVQSCQYSVLDQVSNVQSCQYSELDQVSNVQSCQYSELDQVSNVQSCQYSESDQVSASVVILRISISRYNYKITHHGTSNIQYIDSNITDLDL